MNHSIPTAPDAAMEPTINGNACPGGNTLPQKGRRRKSEEKKIKVLGTEFVV